MARIGTPRVLFRVAAGPRTGFGHLIRASSLADALGVQLLVSLRGPRAAGDVARRLGGRVLDGGGAAGVLSHHAPELLVIDDRVASATCRWRSAARTLGIPIVSLHDLGIGPGDADLIVDGSVGAERLWRNAARGATTLLGPCFAVLNPRTIGARRDPGGARAAQTVVIALGGGPRRDAARHLAVEILRRCPGATVSVAGGFMGNDPEVAGRTVSWIPPSSLGPSLASATVAVVGGGVTLYEAAALGVPTVSIAVVASQRPTVEAFARSGAAIDGGLLGSGRSRDRVLEAVARQAAGLLRNAVARRRLAGAARKLVDGRGAHRVAGAVRRMLAVGARRAAAR
jgi:spore coat polysaccharide biosynthesis predicted glycosyltransferase SpsG